MLRQMQKTAVWSRNTHRNNSYDSQLHERTPSFAKHEKSVGQLKHTKQYYS